MNSDIAAFDAVTNRYGPVWLSNDGTISVKHAAAPSANSRIDLICIKQTKPPHQPATPQTAQKPSSSPAPQQWIPLRQQHQKEHWPSPESPSHRRRPP